MPIVQPPQQRHAIREEESFLKLMIPSRKPFFTIFFLGFWLVVWAFGEVTVLGAIFGGVFRLFFDNPGALQEIGAGGLAGLLGGGIFLIVG